MAGMAGLHNCKLNQCVNNDNADSVLDTVLYARTTLFIVLGEIVKETQLHQYSS